MSHENNLKLDTLKYIPVKILPAFAGILTIFFLTRSFSTSTYGVYSFITASILLFSQLVSGWINSSVIYFYTDFSASNKLDLFRTNIFFLQISLLVIGGIGIIVVSYIGLKDVNLAISSFVLMTVQVLIALTYSFLQAERKIKLQISCTIIQSLVQITCVFLCYFLVPNNLGYLIYALISSYVITFIFLNFKISDSFFFNKNFLNYIDLNLCKQILVYGFPICLWFFTTQFYSVGDRILLKYFDIRTMVGNYASFRDLSVGICGFITMPLLMASHPIIVQMWKSKVNAVEIENLLSNNVKLLIDVFTPFFIGLLLVGKLIMVHVVGAKYLLETQLMLLIFMSIFLSAISMYLHKALEITGKTALMLKISLLVAFFSLIANCILLPIYGVPGACVISVVSQILYCGIVYHKSKAILVIKIPLKDLIKHLSILILAIFMFVWLQQDDLTNIALKIAFISVATVYLFYTSPEIKSIAGQFSKRTN